MRRRSLIAVVCLAISCPLAVDGGAPSRPVKLTDAMLAVEGRPFFFFAPTAQAGNPPDLLKSYHYNTVFLHGPTAVRRVEEQDTGGLWLMPFFASDRWPMERMQQNVRKLVNHPKILIWNIGDDLTDKHAERVRTFYDWLKANDPLERPCILDYCRDRGYEKSYEWLQGGMPSAYEYPLLRTKLEDYQQILRDEIERAGTDRAFWTWTQVHTQDWYNTLFLGGNSTRNAEERPYMYPDPEHVRLLSYHAMAAGVKGIVQYRGAFLKPELGGRGRLAESGIVGCELEIIGPWLAAAERKGKLQSDDRVDATRFDFPQGTLVLLVRTGEHYEFHADQAPAKGTPIQLPGYPALAAKGASAYLVGFPELRDLPQDKYPAIEDAWELTAAVLITADEQLVSATRGAVAARLPDVARFAVEVTETKLDHVTHTVKALKGYQVDVSRMPDDSKLKRVAQGITKAKSLLADGEQADAYTTARAAQRLLRGEIYRSWNAMWEDPALAFAAHDRPVTPANSRGMFRDRYATHDFFLMPFLYRIAYVARKGKVSQNLVVNPSFEDVDEGTGQCRGWKLKPNDLMDKPGAFRTGQRALQLTSPKPRSYQNRSVDWVTRDASSEEHYPVQMGDVIQASVWVSLPEDFRQTQRGAILNLARADAQGTRLRKWSDGLIQTRRLERTDGWHKLNLLHIVTDPDLKQIAFRVGVCGIGTALFDDASLVITRLPAAKSASVKDNRANDIVRNGGFEKAGNISPWKWSLAGQPDATGELDDSAAPAASPDGDGNCARACPRGISTGAKCRWSSRLSTTKTACSSRSWWATSPRASGSTTSRW